MSGEGRPLPMWERIVRRMLAEGVNFDKPEQGMRLLREELLAEPQPEPES